MSSVALAGILWIGFTSEGARAQTVGGSFSAGIGGFMCCTGTVTAVDLGGGVDVPFGPQVSLAGQFRVVGPLGDDRSGPSSPYRFSTLQLLDLDGSFYFGSVHSARRSVLPFLTGGLTLVFGGDGTGATGNFGGGVDYWFTERRGMRLEVRDDILPQFGTTHVIVLRGGIIFR